MSNSWGAAYDSLAALIERRAGLILSEARRAADLATITRCMRDAGLKDVVAYHELLLRDQMLLERLAAELSVGETYFFRDTAQFELLRERILPELATRKSGPIRIWSAGCASGEEAYSLAILAYELGIGRRVSILGTDIAESRLERARAGVYGRWSFRGVSDAVMSTYFTQRGTQLKLSAELRKRVQFQPFNLASLDRSRLFTGIGQFDLVLCRNVLIYFAPETARRVTSALYNALADGGFLLLGASDPTGDLLHMAEVVPTLSGLVYRRSAALAAPVVAAPAPPPVAATPPTPQPRAVQSAPPARPVLAIDYAAQVRSLADRGQLLEAERMCIDALKQQRETAELWYLQAMLLTQRSHIRPAVRAARQALYLDPQMVVAHLALGTALIRGGEREAAQRSFRNAERLLMPMPAGEPVPASGGESAGSLLEYARMHLRLLSDESAA